MFSRVYREISSRIFQSVSLIRSETKRAKNRIDRFKDKLMHDSRSKLWTKTTTLGRNQIKLTSTVGFPRLSKIWRALTALIVTIVRSNRKTPSIVFPKLWVFWENEEESWLRLESGTTVVLYSEKWLSSLFHLHFDLDRWMGRRGEVINGCDRFLGHHETLVEFWKFEYSVLWTFFSKQGKHV